LKDAISNADYDALFLNGTQRAGCIGCLLSGEGPSILTFSVTVDIALTIIKKVWLCFKMRPSWG